jgi:phage terminase large subunit-like protein
MVVSRRSNTHHKAFDKHRAALLQQQMLGLEADDIARILSQLQGKPEPEPVPDEKDWEAEDLALLERGLPVDVLQARRDFASFCRYLDPELEPAAHHQQWHKYLITEQSNKYLYRIAGEKLSILSPRGSSKSTVLGLFLAWAIGIHAERSRALQILYISANREIALAKSETIRNLLTTEKYQDVFPFVQPNSKKWANTVWSIDRKAAGIETTGQEEFSMIAAGVLGTIVSKRCFPAGTKVQTELGSIPIESLAWYNDIKVKSFNHDNESIEYRRIQGHSTSKVTGLVEVTTSKGTRLCCTPDHPIYTVQWGYRDAGSLVPGDTVIISAEEKSDRDKPPRLSVLQSTDEAVCHLSRLQALLPEDQGAATRGGMHPLQKDFQGTSFNLGWEDKSWFDPVLLWKDLLSTVQVRVNESSKALSRLWGNDFRSGFGKSWGSLRFLSLQGASSKQSSSSHLSSVREGVQEELPSTVLFPRLFKQSSQSANDWRWQQSFQAWQLLQQAVLGTTFLYLRKGWTSVRNLWRRGSDNNSQEREEEKQSPYSSHRLRPGEQSCSQSDLDLQCVSHTSPCHLKAWETDTISSVRVVGSGEVWVYDIQVEGNHNFFAEEVLVHNCHLTAFDDLIKNPDDISNPAVREKMIRTINAAVRPTLLPGGRQLSVGTRFTGNDIHCTDFIPEKGWDLLEQSALVLPGELGAFYPAGQKRVDEEVLPPEQELVSYWENMWSTEYLKQLEAEDRISFGYQFQNKISAVRGEGIDPADIQYGLPPHDFDYLCIGCDLAVSKRQAADYTVFTLVGKRGNEYWVLDFWRGKETGNLPKINRLIELYENWADETGEFVIPWRIAVEKVAYQASLCDDLTRELYQKHSLHNIVVLPHRMKGDKRAHIQSVTGVFANKLVFFNEMVDWGYFVSELTGSTRHDDCADSLIIALQSLGVRRKLASIDSTSFGAGEEEEEMNQSLWGNWY